MLQNKKEVVHRCTASFLFCAISLLYAAETGKLFLKPLNVAERVSAVVSL